MKKFLLFFTGAFLTVGTFSLQAQVGCVLSFKATALLQSPITTNGSVTSASTPTKYSITTKSLLSALATALTISGDYAGPIPFPAGAKIVGVQPPGQGAVDFQVWDKNNNFLADASSVLGSGPGGAYQNQVISGQVNYDTRLALPTYVSREIASIRYDDTALAGSTNTKFYLGGLTTDTYKDSTPNPGTGAYTSSQSHTMSGGAGEGISTNGTQLVLTGTASYSGKGTIFP